MKSKRGLRHLRALVNIKVARGLSAELQLDLPTPSRNPGDRAAFPSRPSAHWNPLPLRSSVFDPLQSADLGSERRPTVQAASLPFARAIPRKARGQSRASQRHQSLAFPAPGSSTERPPRLPYGGRPHRPSPAFASAEAREIREIARVHRVHRMARILPRRSGERVRNRTRSQRGELARRHAVRARCLPKGRGSIPSCLGGSRFRPEAYWPACTKHSPHATTAPERWKPI